LSFLRKQESITHSLSFIPPPFFSGFDFFYFLEAVTSAAVNAGAFLGGLVPGSGAFQIARPERPDSTLPRPNSINHASLLAVDFLQEYAIFSRALFNNRRP